MAAEVLSFQKEEGKTAYYATFVSDGDCICQYRGHEARDIVS